MDKRSALKLQPGDRVVFGNSMWSAKVRVWHEATVVHVTPRGGIKVRADRGGSMWVPYHHVNYSEPREPASLGDSATARALMDDVPTTPELRALYARVVAQHVRELAAQASASDR